jgi:Leucine Rich repeats (2 copies)
LFKEYNKLNHFVLNRQLDKNLCEKLNLFQKISSMTMASEILKNEEILCLKARRIKIYITGNFSGSADPGFISLVTGIENFTGNLKDLKNYKSLNYLGLKNYDLTARMGDIFQIRNLTNLSLNLRNVQAIEDISLMKNLTKLTLYCFDDYNESTLPYPTCNSASLRRIEFISQLYFLQALNLNYNSIEDITALTQLKNLTYLNLSHNQIHQVPNIESSSNLETVNLNHNFIDDVSNITNTKIAFDLSNNPINIFSSNECPLQSPNESIRKLCKSN